MKNQLLSFLFIIGLLTVTACSTQEQGEQSGESVFDQEPISVITKIAGQQQTSAGTILSGNIVSQDQATVSARMSGYVNALKVKLGDKVYKGQALMSLNNQELPAKRAQAQANVNEAQAALNNVKINYDRMKTLWEQSSITKKEWDDISAQYEMVKAKIEGAKQMVNEVDQVLGLTVVKAPISGVVTSKMINDGDLVNPGVPLLNIESDTGFDVLTYVSDQQIPHIKKGMKVDCQIQALQKTVSAIVSELAPSASKTGGQYAIKAKLVLSKEDLPQIFSGMYANILVDLPQINKPTSSVTIPKNALFKRGQLTGLYTVSKQNTALLRWVRLGKEQGNDVEIVSGLKEGEKYISDIPTGLCDGIPVLE